MSEPYVGFCSSRGCGMLVGEDNVVDDKHQGGGGCWGSIYRWADFDSRAAIEKAVREDFGADWTQYVMARYDEQCQTVEVPTDE